MSKVWNMVPLELKDLNDLSDDNFWVSWPVPKILRNHYFYLHLHHYPYGTFWILCNQCYLTHILITTFVILKYFFQICQKVLDNDAPRKKDYVRGNHKPFLNKKLPEAIMQRTHFRNKFLKNPADENRYI